MIRALFPSQFRLNAASGVATNLLSLGIAAGSYPVYIHFLGYEVFGTWLVLSTLVLLAQLLKGAICPVLVKMVAEKLALHLPEEAAEDLNASTALLLIGSFCGLLAASILLPYLGPLLHLSASATQLIRSALPWTLLLVIPQTGSECVLSALAGAGRIDLANLHALLSRILVFIAASALLFGGARVSALIAANCVGAIYLWIAGARILKRFLPEARFRLNRQSLRVPPNLLHAGKAMAGATTLAMLVHPLNRLLVSRLAGPAAIPVYEIGFTACMRFRNVAEAGLRALVPEVSSICSTGTAPHHRVRTLLLRSILMLAVAGIPAYFMAIEWAPFFSRLFLGPSYPPALPAAARILFLGSFFSLLSTPAYYILIGMGRYSAILVGEIAQFAVNFGTVAVLAVLAPLSATLVVPWGAAVGMVAAALAFVAFCVPRSAGLRQPLVAV